MHPKADQGCAAGSSVPTRPLTLVALMAGRHTVCRQLSLLWCRPLASERQARPTSWGTACFPPGHPPAQPRLKMCQGTLHAMQEHSPAESTGSGLRIAGSARWALLQHVALVCLYAYRDAARSALLQHVALVCLYAYRDAARWALLQYEALVCLYAYRVAARWALCNTWH